MGPLRLIILLIWDILGLMVNGFLAHGQVIACQSTSTDETKADETKVCRLHNQEAKLTTVFVDNCCTTNFKAKILQYFPS